MAGGHKRKALSRTPSKVIINMDIAIEVLNKTEVGNLHDILEKLENWNRRNRRLWKK